MEHQTKIIFIPVIVALVTQLVKFILYSIKHGWKLEYALTHGHMPSTHSAIAASLVMTTGYLDGTNSAAFLVAFVFAIIVLDDALRIRMYLGDQGRYLNMLIQTLKIDTKKYPRLKERVGHRTSEVIVGIVFGLFLTALLINLWGQN